MKTLVIALIATLGLYAQEASAACGTVEVAKGEVKIESGSTHKISPALVGIKVCSGDTVLAGKDSRAKLKMEDGNELNVSPDSKIVLETYQFDASTNKKKVLLNILSGKVRATTKQENMYNDKAADGTDNTFQVRTKSAVAGVRGTDFLTSFDPKTSKTEVVTFRGKVEFGKLGASGQILASVQVTAGQKTELVAGQPPAPPKVLPTKDLQQMNSETKSETPPPKAEPAAANDKKTDKKEEPKSGPNAGAAGGGAGGAAAGGAAGAGSAAAAPAAGANSGSPAAVAEPRGPASSFPGGSMLTDTEKSGGAPIPVAAPAPQVVVQTPAVPQLLVTSPTVCQSCIDAVRSGPSKVHLNVTIK